MEISWLQLFVLSVASFRLTRLLVYDKITEFIRTPFFNEVKETNDQGEEAIYLIPKPMGIRRFLGELLSCHWCTGIWSAAVLYGLYVIFPFVAIPIAIILSIAGVGALIETVIQALIQE
ncbi:DUF1360 domain-containing protein [Bacillus sp. 2205SS5-2]|uniref:DUF1360 domain-containing protein n=1 Tax=Bacillus sp. 2205SS5-2 TaxID=3109031 RepID=UPI0030069D92